MNPLLTDMYQIKMAFAAWKGHRHNEMAVCEMFFRKAPFGGKYAIFAGHDELYSFLEKYRFTTDHICYLKQTLRIEEPEFFEWLQGLDCSCIRVSGALEGEIVFPDQPLLRLEGPIALLQLIETPLLNLTNFSTLLATNASRMRLLAGESQCVEFGLRRAQGPNGAMIASKYSYLAGFEGSSNVYSGYLSAIPVSGTQAHSFIMSFEKEEDILHSRILKGVDLLNKCLTIRDKLGWVETNLGELYAFISFAHAYPDSFSSLIDSYSTMNSGIKNYLIVALVLKELGYDAKGVRLDSGDLA
jgi:nicotinate phosphoribosyltransferase